MTMKRIRRALGSLGSLRSTSKDDNDRGGGDDDTFSSPGSSHPSLQLTSDAGFSRPHDGTYVRYDDHASSASYGDPLKTTDPSFTKLHKWSFLGDITKIKKFMLKTDVNCEDGDRRTPLHLCAFGGDPEPLSFLLSSGANIEAEDKDGRTPLLRAVERGHIRATQALLQHKANALAKDLHDTTALHLAARTASTDLMDLLLEVGLDYELKDVRGQTPLHVATSALDTDMVKCLLAHEADPNTADKEGVTPLMMATKQGFKLLAEILIESSADLSQVDCSGWNASSYARYSGHMELHNWLEGLMSEGVAAKGHSSNKMLGLRSSDTDNWKGGSICSEVGEDSGSGNSNSWNDDSSEESMMNRKPKINFSRFMSASNDSVGSIASFNSQNSVSSSASMPGPRKPPRSSEGTPDLKKETAKLKQSLSLPESPSFGDEETDALRKSPKEIKILNIGLERKKKALTADQDDLPNISKLFESKDTDHSLGDVSFSDDGEDDILPLDQTSVFSHQEDVLIKDANEIEEERLPRNYGKPEEFAKGKIESSESLHLETKLTDSLAKDEENKLDIDSVMHSESDDRESLSMEPRRDHPSEDGDSTISNPIEQPKSAAAVSGGEQIVKESAATRQDLSLEGVEAYARVSKEGTLGRIDTLQQTEELWEANASLSQREDLSESSYGGSSTKSAIPKHLRENNISSLKKMFFGDSKEDVFFDNALDTKMSLPAKHVSPTRETFQTNDVSNTETNAKTSDVLSTEVEVEKSEISNVFENFKTVVPENKKDVSETLSSLNTLTISVLESKDAPQVVVASGNIENNVFDTTKTFQSDVTSKSAGLNTKQNAHSDDISGEEENKREEGGGNNENVLNARKRLFLPVEDSAIDKHFPERDETSKHVQHCSEIFEPDLRSLDSITSPESEASLNLEIYSLGNLKGPLDVARVHQIIRNLKVLLNRENTRKKNYQLQLDESKHLENLLREEIKEYERVFGQYLGDIAKLQSQKNSLEYDLFRSEDEASFVSLTLKETKDQMMALDQENAYLRIEMVGKDHLIKVLENDLETKDRITVNWETKFNSLPSDPIWEERGVQTLEKVMATIGTQAMLKSTKDVMTDTVGISTSTDGAVTLTDTEIQTDDFGVSDQEVDDVEEHKLEKESYIHLSTQTSFERPSKDSQTDDDSMLKETEGLLESKRESKTTSEQDCTMDCISSETQTVHSISNTEVQTDNDSGLGVEGRKVFGNGTQETQTIPFCVKEGSCQTAWSEFMVESSSQTLCEGLLCLSENYGLSYQSSCKPDLESVFTQTEASLQQISCPKLSEDFSTEIKSIIKDSNDSLKQILLKFSDKTDETKQFDKEPLVVFDKESIIVELSHFREAFLKVIADIDKKMSEEQKRLLAEPLECIQGKLSCLETTSQQFDSLHRVIANMLSQNGENAAELKENSGLIKNVHDHTTHLREEISKVILRSVGELQSELLALSKKSDPKVETILSNLSQLQSNVDMFCRNVETNERNLDELRNNVCILIERWDRQDDVVRDMISSEKQKQENHFYEVTSLMEQITRDNDGQLQRNLKASLRSLDGTIGENFEIIQNLITNLRNDLTKKVNETLMTRARETQGQEIERETLSSDVEKINASLSNLRTLIESKCNESSSESLFDIGIIEAIRGGNDQALTTIQAQGKSILKTLEICNQLLKEMVNLGLNSKISVSPEKEVETYRKSLELQKEYFIKETETLERQNAALEAFLTREKKYSEEQKAIRKELETEIKSLKSDNHSLREANISLRLIDGNIKNQYGNLISKIFDQQQLECNSRSALLVKTSDIFEKNNEGCRLEDPFTMEAVRNLENNLRLEKEKNLLQEADRQKMSEVMRQEKAEFIQQITKLKNEIRTKETLILTLEKKISPEKEILQKGKRETELEKKLTTELKDLKENIRMMENEIRTKDKLMQELRERVDELESEKKDLEVDLNIRVTQMCELKSEILLLQKKIKSLSKKLEDQVYDDKLSAILRQRNEELEKEVFQNQSVILNLRERIRSLAQEKAKLTREISLYQEEKVSSDILLTQKEEAKESLRKLENEFERMKESIEEEFIPKSKLESLYQEMEAHFGCLVTKRLYDCQKPMVENLRTLEHANGILKGREEALKIEMKGLLDKMQLLSAKVNFSNYNAQLWKSKYQQLFEEQRHRTSLTNGTSSFVGQLPSFPENAVSESRQDVLEDIDSLLKKPYEKSAFLGNLIDLSSPLYPTNTPPDKPSPLLYTPLTTPFMDTLRPVEMEKRVVLDSLENSLKKYLPAERDGGASTSASRGIADTLRSAESPPLQPLQQSIDSYINFLRTHKN